MLRLNKCPECKGDNVVYCKGGTCYRENPKLSWLCADCLNEW